MRKIFIMGLFALLIMQACKKNDQELIDGQRPEERVAADLEKYRNELVNSPNGWVAYLNTTVVGGSYNFYMTFDKDNKVTMRADYDTDIALESIQSTYRLKQVMAPSIIFDTYTLLHLLQDPDDESFDGDYADGYGSDFEFEIREQVGDTIKLIGKKRKAPLILVKATADEKAFYTSDQFSDNIGGITKYINDNPFTYILDPKDNNRKIQVSISPTVRSRSLSFASVDGADVITKSDIFSFSKDGLKLGNPIEEIGLIFTEVLWDAAAEKLFLVATSGAKVEILSSAIPIIPLHFSMGSMVKKMDVPGIVALPGSSTSFVSAYNTMRTTILNGFPTLTTPRDFGISFNAVNKTCVVYMVIVQGTTGFPANYTFNYTKTDNGEYKFIGPPVVSGGGGAAIVSVMNTFLLNRMAAQTFTLDYYVDSANKRVLGKMTSKETPTFFFTGVIN